MISNKTNINKCFFIYILFFSLFNDYQSKFLFSVIISIYNTGRYLNDSIGSLLNQTINFYDNIQIILVNDGSTDNSEEICLNYRDKYSNNIIYVFKKNEGLSSARNMGLKYAKGDFINFLDPDDLWSNNSFKFAAKFFRLNPNIDLVTGRMKFFEASNDYHPLDYKFYESRIIDLNKEYSCIHLSVASSFFRRTAINDSKFVQGVISGEDTLFVNKLLLNKPFYGVLKKALYFYRRRSDGTSIVQTSKTNDIFYFVTPKFVHQYLLDISLSTFNRLVPFIQYYVAYDILYRIVSSTFKYLNLSKFIKYSQIIIKLLKRIDDQFILEQKNVGNEIKIYALSIKHEEDMRKYIIFEKGNLKYSEYNMIELDKFRNLLSLKVVDIKGNTLHIEARDNCWMEVEKYYYYCVINYEKHLPSYEIIDSISIKTMFGTIIKGRIVYFDIPLKDKYINYDFKFHFCYMNKTKEIFPTFGYFCHVPPINNSYYIKGNNILMYNGKRLILKENYNGLSEILENNYCKELERIEKKELISIRELAIQYSKKPKKKEIWLINDRYNKAGDNGEFFFRYLKNKNPEDINFYFVISKNCSDYQRMKDLDNILDVGSKEYNLTFLNADKIISSSANSWVDNPFGEDRKYLIDLYHFDLIFLQHGISKDDVSNFLHKFMKNYSLIVTASKFEYNSFLSTQYGYTSKNIKLTGFSRFDNLRINENKNINYSNKTILLIPTWRMNLKGTFNPITFEGIYSNNFKNSDFFIFYNSLMNSPKLLDAMKKYNYTGIFCLHPSFSEQWRDFNNNSLFNIMNKYDYQTLFLKSSILITDYSSVFFDFAYLKKPIIYTQFDNEEYRKNHYQKGYFDYHINGFGPICLDLENCINVIIDALKDGCKMKIKYLRRVQKFFAFFDTNNNNRIYNSIRNVESFGKKYQRIINSSIIIIIILIIISKFIYKYKIPLFFIYINYYKAYIFLTNLISKIIFVLFHN